MRVQAYATAMRASHWLHDLGHRSEHSLHLMYFACLSTGLVDYHLVAVLCLVVGIASMFPAGEPT